MEVGQSAGVVGNGTPQDIQETGQNMQAGEHMEKSSKGFVPTLLLCFFLGSFGVHRFYVGKIGTGILCLLTLGCLGIWTLVDFIMIAIGSFKDKQGRPIKN